jgi:uncharacterized protein (DUF2141 family)
MMLLAGAAQAASLDVVVANVRNDKGTVRVAICDQAEFLKPTCAHIGSAPAHPGDVLVHIDDIPPGIWAAQAYHDENDNHEIDRNILGSPTEGLGFSNDAKMMFGPPSFAAAAFQLSSAGGGIRFSLKYY